jgi:hypothetical protein
MARVCEASEIIVPMVQDVVMGAMGPGGNRVYTLQRSRERSTF